MCTMHILQTIYKKSYSYGRNQKENSNVGGAGLVKGAGSGD